jgi:predicted nuclease of restriction endonuclease-like (RecB) superfamily
MIGSKCVAKGKGITSKTRQPAKRNAGKPFIADASLLIELQALIRDAREQVARAVNSALVMVYWQVGHRIRTEILKNKRAEYGELVVPMLARELTAEFGSGFSRQNLFRMTRFAELFPDREIVSTLSRQLGWSHFVEIIPLKDQLKREYYAEMCRIEQWSVRTLRSKIDGMLFERTALSRKPERLARQELARLHAEGTLTPDLVFRDPYLLHFLGLKDTYSEKDLETAILREMEQFILELGVGFTFAARQKRIVIDGEDFYLDLLFYHRKLRRLVAVELKLERFKATDKGQMELYLRWLEKHEREPGEATPIGLILCEDKGDEQVELLQLDQSGIRVATYLTDLPSKTVLQKKLRAAAELARQRLERRSPRDKA